MRALPCAAGILLLAAPAQAQCELSKLSACEPPGFTPRFDQEFGAAVAASGDRIAVGAPAYGDVRVYELSGHNWRLAASLAPALPDPFFGHMLAFDGATILVAGEGPGVYVFEELAGAWTATATLLPGSPVADYPTSLSLAGDRAAIGDVDLASSDGRVFLFERTAPGAWTQGEVLAPSNPALIERFGHSLALDGDLLLVGCLSTEAYAFRHDGTGWDEEGRLTTRATSLALHGDVAVAGNWSDSTQGVSAGAATIYERVQGAWQEAGFVTASDGGQLHYFGFSVDVHDGLVVVGAPYRNAPQSSADGGAYAFHKAGGAWHETALIPPGRGAQDNIGRDVATNGSLAVLSAPKDDDEGPDLGAVYAMSPDASLCATLQSFPRRISVASGGTFTMLLRAPISEAGRPYLVLGTLAGTVPGFSAGGLHVPLTPDGWYVFTRRSPNRGPLVDTFGTLDASARGAAALVVPGGSPALAGLKAHHAFVTLDFGPLSVRHVSTPVVLRLEP